MQGTWTKPDRWPCMTEPDFISKLIAQIEELKPRVAQQTTKLERLTGDELIEETAILRNFMMQLDGLKLMLERHEAPK
jgi:hypothetical protein